MKRIFLLLVGTLLTVWAADAQLLGFGARIGIGTGSYEFDSVSIEGGSLEPAGDRVGGYQAALFMRLSIPTFLFIQPEVQFSQREYIFGVKYPSLPKEYKTIRTYRVDVPLLLGFKLGNVRLFGGPVWRIGARQYAKGGGSTPFDIVFNDNDIAAMGGAGVEFDGVFLEVRYTSYLEQTTSEVMVANQKEHLKINHDGTVQINFGVFF
ncbi:MAG: PorT family protein [Tidjanibacter sp.]|nr:PorT family protein [Tidjanibacter sp.]